MQLSGYRAPGAPLVRYLVANGQWSAAVHIAYQARLIDDDDLEAAYRDGTDVLARVELTPAVA